MKKAVRDHTTHLFITQDTICSSSIRVCEKAFGSQGISPLVSTPAWFPRKRPYYYYLKQCSDYCKIIGELELGIHSFSLYLLIVYYVPSIMLHARDLEMNKVINTLIFNRVAGREETSKITI